LVYGVIAPPAAAAGPVRWRTDYNAARKEAQEKGLPLFVVVGTDDCFYCRKLEASTFKDPVIVAALSGTFIPLKIDATREATLARALKVQLYPTMVLAGPDGKIHGFIEGYLEAERLIEHMKRAVTASTTSDFAARDFNEASKALAGGDYPRAVSLLKGIIKDSGEKPVGVKAKEVLEQVERQAAGGLARAKELELKGNIPEAMDALADLIRTYAGTQAATDAARVMAGLAEKPETLERQRTRQARELLAMAKEEFRTGRYYDCLQRCEQLAAGYTDRPEATEAITLAAEVKNNPDRLAAACEQMNQKTAAMYLALADSWMKKGQEKEAMACLEKVTKLCPNSQLAEVAQVQITKLQAKEPNTTAGFKKMP
jgi:thioredoxin-like negative regulator of GroEL